MMPFGDGTGPMGMGPLTGRGAGYCAGFPRLGPTILMVGATVMAAVSALGTVVVLGEDLAVDAGLDPDFGLEAGPVGGWAPGYIPSYVQPYPAVPPYYPAGPVEDVADEAGILQEQAAYLKEELEAIEGRLAELKKLAEDKD
jgi:hypothetical protein